MGIYKKKQALFFIVLLIVQCCQCEPYNKDNEKDEGFLQSWQPYLIYGVIAAMVAAILVPAAAGAIGFTAAGIAAHSLAASMMSAAYTLGVGGGAVAILQSIGAVGIGLKGMFAAGLTGAAFWGSTRNSDKEKDRD